MEGNRWSMDRRVGVAAICLLETDIGTIPNVSDNGVNVRL